MPVEVVYKNDYGYAIDIKIEEYNWDTEEWETKDISGFSGFTYKIEKPDGTIVSVTPQLKTDGTDGFLRFTTDANTVIFDQKGTYQIVALLEGGSQQFHSTVYRVDIDTPLS